MASDPIKPPAGADDDRPRETAAAPANSQQMPKEIGGPKGPEPTRYGDWERNGRCSDF